MPDPNHFNNQPVGVYGINYPIRALSYAVLTFRADKLTNADGERVDA